MNLDTNLIITSALTAGGAPVWAAAIQTVIQTLKAVPQLKARVDGREKLLCFVLALVVAVLAFAASLGMVPPTASLDIPGVVLAALAWFTLARLSMAFYDDFLAREDPNNRPVPKQGARPPESVLSKKGWL